MKRTNTGLREQINYEQLANMLLDDMIELRGLNDTCYMLLLNGYKKRELYYLGFDKEVIDDAHKRLKKEEREYARYKTSE
jgi:hypothetical protein